MPKELHRLVSVAIGGAVVIVGILGFFAGNNILGFGINILHNFVHIITGSLGVFASQYAEGKYSFQYNRWMGLTYIAIGAIGFAIPSLLLNLLNVNFADNILHTLLGVILASIGFAVKNEQS